MQAGRPEVPLRAAYHGHCLELAEQLNEAEKAADAAGDHSIVTAMQLASGWAPFVEGTVEPRLANCKRDAWEAPMPAADGEGLATDDFPTSIDLPDTYTSGTDEFGNTYEVRSWHCEIAVLFENADLIICRLSFQSNAVRVTSVLVAHALLMCACEAATMTMDVEVFTCRAG